MSLAYPTGPRTSIVRSMLDQLRPGAEPFDILAFVLDIARNYGPIACWQIGSNHIYQLNDPDLIRDMLVERAALFHKTKQVKLAFGRFLGDGLLTSDGEFWQRQRKLAQPAFHFKRIEAYADVMVAHTLRMLDRWRPGETRDIAHEMAGLTMSIVGKTLFDADVSDDAPRIRTLMETLLHGIDRQFSGPFRLPTWLPTPTNRREQHAQREFDALVYGMINERRRSGDDKGDLLSMLLHAVDDDNQGMTDQQVRNETLTLFAAGHETTANALAWTWYLLDQNPAVEQKLRDELALLGDRPPSIHDLRQLPYTELVVKEALRLYPPASGFSREPIQDLELGGYTIKAGSPVLIWTYALHRDPRFFPDPERFVPERWAAESKDAIPKYAYLPFGGGPRVCIGNTFALMEARLLLATILQRYHLALKPGYKVVPQQLVTTRPRGGLPMRITQHGAMIDDAHTKQHAAVTN